MEINKFAHVFFYLMEIIDGVIVIHFAYGIMSANLMDEIDIGLTPIIQITQTIKICFSHKSLNDPVTVTKKLFLEGFFFHFFIFPLASIQTYP